VIKILNPRAVKSNGASDKPGSGSRREPSPGP
jgi:hypothetical protein